MPRTGRFPLLFLGSAVAVALAIVLLVQLGGDDDDGGARPVATAPASVPEGPQTSGTTTTGGVAGERERSDEPMLRAGRTELLPLPEGGLASVDGEEVRGRRLVVVAVGAETFAVSRAAGDADRVEVQHGGSYAPQRGDRVDLRGVVDGSRVRATTVVPEGTGPGVDGDSDVSGGEEDRP